MKIFVAGGAGFIGSHLVDQLLENGHDVICLDNLITGHKENISQHLKNKKFKFLLADVTASLPKGLQVDQIFHLASPASPAVGNPRGYHALWDETMRVNTLGTWNLAELALKNSAPILFSSTSEIYGDPLEHPQKETYRGNVSTIGPRSVYDEAKRFGETILSAYHRKKGLQAKIVRIFNTYGPRMDLDEGRVVYNMTVAALKGKEIPVTGDGSQTRSFCFVSDLVDGLNLVMNSDQATGEVINLGNPREFTILELAQKVIKMTKSSSKIKFVPRPEDDPKKRKPDISKAKELLNWEPKVQLDEGLLKTIEYVRSVLDK